ncbi:hypothetical protein [Mumia sp. Pv 4-285]|uniref:hypothetical protein n=1 Tax=Mumia qirimensis TaxID=3234852 RepID=UPI00351D628A
MGDEHAVVYEIVADGVLTEGSRSTLRGMGLAASTRPDGSVVLRGEFAGLAELNDVIFSLEDLGLGLVSVRQIP